MEERISVLEAKYDSIEKMFEMALNSMQSQMNFLMWFVGFGIPLFSIIIGTVAVRQYVKSVVDNQLEERLISLYEKNPPTFSHGDVYSLTDDRKIHFESNIKGFDQLTEKTLIQLTMYIVDSTVKREQIVGIIKKDSKMNEPYIQVFLGSEYAGKDVHVSLTWKRIKIEK